jgi:menaquinone-dependent protoporphyrinogen oxidase
MATILIIYSSTDGQTKKICQRLQRALAEQAHQVTLVSVADALHQDLRAFDKIVVGASIRYGKHHPHIVRLIHDNAELLNQKPSALFSVNLVARKPEKSQPETNPYMRRFLKQITWRPKLMAVFAGKIDYPSYGIFDRLIIQLIMLITKGPTDPRAVIEFTDWQQVYAFARRIGEL